MTVPVAGDHDRGSLLPPRMVGGSRLSGSDRGRLLALTFVAGVEIKGRGAGSICRVFAAAPEFIKPTFAVVAAWLFSERRTRNSPATIARLFGVRRDADQAARPGHDRRRRGSVAGAVLHGGLGSLGVVGGPGSSAGLAAPICGCRMSPAASIISSTGAPARTTRSTARSKPSPMAGCGGAARARARSRVCCPTPMPISSSPSPARSSA